MGQTGLQQRLSVRCRVHSVDVVFTSRDKTDMQHVINVEYESLMFPIRFNGGDPGNVLDFLGVMRLSDVAKKRPKIQLLYGDKGILKALRRSGKFEIGSDIEQRLPIKLKKNGAARKVRVKA